MDCPPLTAVVVRITSGKSRDFHVGRESSSSPPLLTCLLSRGRCVAEVLRSTQQSPLN